jgi:hypothetical protein
MRIHPASCPGGRGLVAVIAAIGAYGGFAGVSAAALPPSCGQSAQTVSCTYTSGSNPFTVPSGVSTIRVVAVGGMGGNSVLCTTVIAGCQEDAAGGFGATVSAQLAVSPGSTVYAVVGVNGVSGTGGGASDLRAAQNDLSTRLLVAAGGGGAGAPGLIRFGIDQMAGGGGGPGGAAGADGAPGLVAAGGPSQAAGGGSRAASTAGGAGGSAGIVTNIGNCSPACTGGAGAAGELGAGGTGGGGGEVGEPGHVSLAGGEGGGGGGGLFGGGGGGGGSPVGGGAGGGGGSNLVPAGGSQSIDTAGSPMVLISYAAARATATRLSCWPSRFAPGDATVCAVRVTDTAGSGQSTPTGIVGFASSGPGRFFGHSCRLSGSGGSAGCVVVFTSLVPGGQALTAWYGGDAAHTPSAGGTSVAVTVPASTAGCVVFGHGRITTGDADRASFWSQAAAPTLGAEFYRDTGPASPLRVVSTSVAAVTCTVRDARASIFGTAKLDGRALTEYRIDLQLTRRGRTAGTYRIRLSSGYDSGIRPIRHSTLTIRVRQVLRRLVP